MIWNNWTDFFAMGGYALYVWGSVVVVAAFMLGEILMVGSRHRAIQRQIARSGQPRRTK